MSSPFKSLPQVLRAEEDNFFQTRIAERKDLSHGLWQSDSLKEEVYFVPSNQSALQRTGYPETPVFQAVGPGNLPETRFGSKFVAWECGEK